MDLSWLSLQLLLKGESIIDTPQLELKDAAEAHQFLIAYGFDLHQEHQLEQLWKLHAEACEFINSVVLETAEEKIPAILSEREQLQDFRKLLLVASRVAVDDPALTAVGEKLQPWTCAILRVMHTLTHYESDLRLKYLSKIKVQTVDRFAAHIQRAASGEGQEQITLGIEREKIPLIAFEIKDHKIRDSVLVKLLYKAENVAQEVYDHLGVRIVTETRRDIVKVLDYLVSKHLISPANLMPNRCRNSLIDFEDLSTHRERLDLLDDIQFEEALAYPPQKANETNPFSSADYRSLQFTCRPLVRIPVLRSGGIHSEMSFFFPIEVQILDRKSYLSITTGNANHSAYKAKQLEAVRRRVLGW